jgi:hypothetical protein
VDAVESATHVEQPSTLHVCMVCADGKMSACEDMKDRDDFGRMRETGN